MRIYQLPIAHRGLHNKDLPENSMAAFKNALEQGYNIEIDVRLTKDKKVVIFHDPTTNRVIGEAGKISELTYEQLQDEKYRLPNGEVIPLLEDFIAVVDGKTDVLCEIKSTGTHSFVLEAEVYKLIKGKPWIIMQAFNPLTLVWYKKYAPEVVRGQLATSSEKRWLRMLCSMGFRIMHRTKPAFLAYDIRYLPSPRVEHALKKHNMKLICWTIRTEAELEKAGQVNARNIIFEDVSPEGKPKRNNQKITITQLKNRPKIQKGW
ncbi:MAG: glycerophosphodiester phosphodiesterase family protein [Clostridia bacterium]